MALFFLTLKYSKTLKSQINLLHFPLFQFSGKFSCWLNVLYCVTTFCDFALLCLLSQKLSDLCIPARPPVGQSSWWVWSHRPTVGRSRLCLRWQTLPRRRTCWRYQPETNTNGSRTRIVAFGPFFHPKTLFHRLSASSLQLVRLKDQTHSVCGLNRPDQVESFPHIDVPVQSSRVCDVILSRCHTQDGLQVSCLAENAALWRESVSTQSPELQAMNRREKDVKHGLSETSKTLNDAFVHLNVKKRNRLVKNKQIFLNWFKIVRLSGPSRPRLQWTGCHGDRHPNGIDTNTRIALSCKKNPFLRKLCDFTCFFAFFVLFLNHLSFSALVVKAFMEKKLKTDIYILICHLIIFIVPFKNKNNKSFLIMFN